MGGSGGYEILTHAGSGAISVIRFADSGLFSRFADRHLAFNRPARPGGLHYAHMREDEGGEDVLVLMLPFPELHIHGGTANLAHVEKWLQDLQAPETGIPFEARWLSLWEQTFSDIHGERGIQYMLDVRKEGPLGNWDRPFDMEGHEFLRPLHVVLAGPANAGKSSLFNCLLGGAHALVSDVAGTTRDVLCARMQVAGHDVELLDTAGFLEIRAGGQESTLQDLGEAASRAALGQADIILNFGGTFAQATKAQVIDIHGKCDEAAAPAKSGALPVSARTGQGLDELLDQLGKKVRTLKRGVPSARFHRDLAKTS